MSELTKEYFDAKFDAVSDRLEKIERSQSEIFEVLDRHRELIGQNNTSVQLIKSSLDSGNKKFSYIEREIDKVHEHCKATDCGKVKQQVAILMKVLAAVGTGFLGLAVKAIFDLF
jgi:chromosome segregation ATPase